MAMDPMTMYQIGSTAISFLQAQKQARADEARYQQNRINAAVARDLKIQTLNRRMIQEGEAAAAQKQDLAIAALKKEGTAIVGAGEAGFKGGSSIDNTISQFETARLRGVTVLNQQTENLRNQIELEKLGASAEAMSRIDSMPRGQQPSFLAYAAQAGAQYYAGAKAQELADPVNIAKRITDINTEVTKLAATQAFGNTLPKVDAGSYTVGYGQNLTQR